MNRVAIVGCSGSGKTTLALALAEKTGLPVHHLDQLFWKPGWVETKPEDFLPVVTELTKSERWIIDGIYGRSMDVRFSAADTIVFLDLPRWRCLINTFSRFIRYRGRVAPKMPPGCVERFEWSFYRWIWNFPRTHRPGILEKLARHAVGHRIVILRSHRETERFLDEFKTRIRL